MHPTVRISPATAGAEPVRGAGDGGGGAARGGDGAAGRRDKEQVPPPPPRQQGLRRRAGTAQAVRSTHTHSQRKKQCRGSSKAAGGPASWGCGCQRRFGKGGQLCGSPRTGGRLFPRMQQLPCLTPPASPLYSQDELEKGEKGAERAVRRRAGAGGGARGRRRGARPQCTGWCAGMWPPTDGATTAPSRACTQPAFPHVQ